MATPTATFDDLTIDDFRAYERVRADGRFNMFDPNARALTGLSKDTYLAVMKNYRELVTTFPGIRKE